MFARDIFKDEKAPAFALLAAVLKNYGMEALEYEPELLRAELEKKFDITISDLQNDKLHAAIIVLTTNQFETDWRVFEVVSHLFNNVAIDHDDFEPLEAEEIAVALAEVMLIKESVLEEKEILEYDDEIRAYAGIVFAEYGFHRSPKIFPTALMPKWVKVTKISDDTAKNEALQELFDAHATYVVEYMDRIQVL